MNPSKIKLKVKELLAEEQLGVLATADRAGAPYTSLVGFLPGTDIREIYFATFKSTRKYANIEQNPRVSLLIDSRKNRPEDFKDSAAVTVLGKAASSSSRRCRDLYIARFPHLEDFILDPQSELLKITVSMYILAQRFQEVFTLDPR